jgi:hypothetical protein
MLSFDDMEEITEDEVNSFLNVFERYFDRKDIFYRYGDYFEISIPEFDSMMIFLEDEISASFDYEDWDYRMAKMVYDKMKAWRSNLEESIILFEHDC